MRFVFFTCTLLSLLLGNCLAQEQRQIAKMLIVLKESQKFSQEEIIGHLNERLTVTELIELKKSNVFTEEEILQFINKTGKPENMNETSLVQLKEYFSEDFLQKLSGNSNPPSKPGENSNPPSKPGENSNPPITKKYRITISVFPDSAGQISCEPPLPEDRMVSAGTRLKIYPTNNTYKRDQRHLFDCWKGDFNGNQTLSFSVNSDCNIEAHFISNEVQSKIPAEIRREDFEDTRKKGYIYSGEVSGKIKGRAENIDWGIAGEAYYEYIYNLKYTSHVQENNGMLIKERRTFDSVEESVVVSDIRFHIDLTQEMSKLKKLLLDTRWLIDYAAKNLEERGNENIARILRRIFNRMERAGNTTQRYSQTFQNIAKYDISLEEIEVILCHLQEGYNSVAEFLQWIKIPIPKLPNGREVQDQFRRDTIARFKNKAKIIGYTPQMKILEGKNFIVQYGNGVGIISVTLEDREKTLSEEEIKLLKRAFYLTDYHIFKDRQNPRRNLEVGAEWEVDASNVASLLDPRLKHEVSGTLRLRRSENQNNAPHWAVFNLIRGDINLTSERKIFDNLKHSELPVGTQSGRVSFKNGTLFYDRDMKYVTKAELNGHAEYKNLSTDHLLFGARLSAAPEFTIKYQCTCTRVE